MNARTSVGQALLQDAPEYDDVIGVVESVAWWASHNFLWDTESYDDLFQLCFLEASRVKDKYLASFNKRGEIISRRGYLYTCLKRYIRKLHLAQQHPEVSIDALSDDVLARLPTYDVLDTHQRKETVQEFLSLLSDRERLVLWFRAFMGYTWGETASKVTALLLGELRAKYDTMRKREVYGERPMFRGDLRKLRTSEKQCRDSYDKVLVKMKVFAVHHNLRSWLRYIQAHEGELDNAEG